jgi:hypothetical protein
MIAWITARTSGGKAANCSGVIGGDMAMVSPIFASARRATHRHRYRRL